MKMPVEDILAHGPSGIWKKSWPVLVLCLAWITINAFVCDFILSEKAVFSWDNIGHWRSWVNYVDIIRESPKLALTELPNSVNRGIYNYVPIAPTALFGAFLGVSRRIYVLLQLNVHVLGFVVCFSLLACRTLSQNKKWMPSFLIVALSVISYPQVVTAILRNYYDVAVLTPCLAIVALAFIDPTRRFRPFVSTLLGLAVLLLAVTRRWMVFWLVALAVGMVVAVGLSLLRERRVKNLLCALGNMALALLICGAVAGTVFPGFLRISFGNDYHYLSQAYRHGSAFSEVVANWLKLGPLHMALACVGAVVGVRSRKWPQLLMSSLFLANVTSGAWFFAKYSGIGTHHRLAFVVTTIGATSLGIGWIVSKLPRRSAACFVGLLLAFAVLNWCCVFVPGVAAAVPRPLLALCSTERCFPSVRGDVAELRSMVSNLRSRCREQKGDAQVAVLACSPVLNSDALNGVDFPAVRQSLPQAQHWGGGDIYDGFPNELFFARYVVVGVPVQIHLASDAHRCLRKLVEGFASGSGLGRHYRSISRYQLDNGVIAAVYERNGPYSSSVISEISGYFESTYPEDEQTHVHLIAPLTVSLNRAANGGEIRCVGTRSVFMHPGATEPTWLVLGVPPGQQKLTFSATFDNRERLLARDDTNGEVGFRLQIGKELAFDDIVTARSPAPISVSIDGAAEVRFEVGPGKHGPNGDWFLLQNIRFE